MEPSIRMSEIKFHGNVANITRPTVFINLLILIGFLTLKGHRRRKVKLELEMVEVEYTDGEYIPIYYRKAVQFIVLVWFGVCLATSSHAAQLTLSILLLSQAT